MRKLSKTGQGQARQGFQLLGLLECFELDSVALNPSLYHQVQLWFIAESPQLAVSHADKEGLRLALSSLEIVRIEADPKILTV